MRIKLCLFGSFRVEMDGQSMNAVLAHSPKGLLLMQYLILKKGSMETAAALTRLLWPEADTSRPDSALKTLISRLRTLLTQVDPALGSCLKTVRGGYRWETAPGVSVDLEEFRALADELQGRIDVTDHDQGLRFRRMLDVYTGRLLADQEQPDWMNQQADRIHKLYLNIVEECLEKLAEAGRHEEVVTLCREAMDADPINGRLNTYLMDALVKQGRENDALRQYRYIAGEGGGESTSPLDAYYVRLLQTDRDLRQCMSEVQAHLLSGEEKPGALMCDKAIFGEVFRLQQRGLERTGGDISLAVAMVSGLEASPWELDAAMTGLLDVVMHNLRRGDAVCRLSATQIAVLLPLATSSDAEKAMYRVKREFYARFPAGCALTFMVTQMK